jgi:hypothetical protein
MGLEMVDADERDAPHERERLGRAQADEKRPHEPGPHRGGNRVDVTAVDAGLDEHLRDHRREQLHVGAARDLRHDAAEARVQVDLARDDRGEHRGATGDDRGRGLVARRLDAEDDGRVAGTRRRVHHDRGSSTIVVPGIADSMRASRCAYLAASTSSAHITSASSFVST